MPSGEIKCRAIGMQGLVSILRTIEDMWSIPTIVPTMHKHIAGSGTKVAVRDCATLPNPRYPKGAAKT